MLSDLPYPPQDGLPRTDTLETEGRPFQLDVVVRCGGLESLRSIGGGAATAYWQTPYLYGRATSMGSAVAIRVPDYCGLLDDGSQRAKEIVEKSKQHLKSIPLVLWFPNKDDLNHATAFTSLRGYDQPNSRLRYRGSRFAVATPDEWLAWKEASGEPFIRRRNDPIFSWSERGSRSDRQPGLKCFGVELLRIPESIRAEVERARPSDSPLGWTDFPLYLKILKDVRKANGNEPNNARIRNRFEGGSHGIDLMPIFVRSEPYDPSDPLMKRMGLSPGSIAVVYDIDLLNQIRGQASCMLSYGFLPIVNLSMGDRSTRLSLGGAVFADNVLVIPIDDYDQAKLVEGSHEGIPE